MAARQDEFLGDAASLGQAARAATLATMGDGQPYAALVTPAFAPGFMPLLLLSQISRHTRHLQGNPACCLLLTGPATSENPQTAPRLALSGTARPVEDIAAARGFFLHIHPYSALYADFADFAFWQIDVARADYVGGFAAAAQLDMAALRQKFNSG